MPRIGSPLMHQDPGQLVLVVGLGKRQLCKAKESDLGLGSVARVHQIFHELEGTVGAPAPPPKSGGTYGPY